jgi:acyl-CoA reductase-like NAD-dependent aldehyde dehydrogenase
VLLKPSPQTPLTGERLALALQRAGLPANVLHVLHLSPTLATFVIQHPLVNFVSFTGSVVGGRTVEQAAVAATGFKGVALEVGPLWLCVERRRVNVVQS